MFKKLLSKLRVGKPKDEFLLIQNQGQKGCYMWAISPEGIVIPVSKEDTRLVKNRMAVKPKPGYHYVSALNQKTAIKKFKKMGLVPLKFVRKMIYLDGEKVFSLKYGAVTMLEVLEDSIDGYEVILEVLIDSSNTLENGAIVTWEKKDLLTLKTA